MLHNIRKIVKLIRGKSVIMRLLFYVLKIRSVEGNVMRGKYFTIF